MAALGRLVSALAACALSACTALTSFNGLSGGDEAPAKPDGGATTASASGGAGTDADATKSDAHGPSNGGNDDAATDGTASAPCPPGAYCASFDTGTVADYATSQEASPGSDLRIEGGELRAKMKAHPETGIFYSELHRTLAETAKTSITIDFDVKFGDVPWGTQQGSASIFILGLDGAAADHSFELYIGPTYASVTTGIAGAYSFTAASTDLPRGKTVHVRMECSFKKGAGFMRLFFDGSQVAERTAIAFTATDTATTLLWLGIARTNAPTPELDVRYDNLVVVALP